MLKKLKKIFNNMLRLSEVRKPLKIDVQSPMMITRLGTIEKKYNIDWDVMLSNGKPLQRDFCWTKEQKSELILSVLKKIMIPPFAFIIGGEDDNTLRVIDGKQRLSTLLDFYNGKIPFTYKGKEYYYDDLDKDAQFEFKFFDIVAITALEPCKENKIIPFNDEDIIEWFKLINFSGTQQNKEHLQYLDSIVNNG